MITTIKSIGIALKKSVVNFGDYAIPKKSASLAYYTLFAIAPLIFLIISLGSIFLGPEVLRGELFDNLGSILGRDIALEIRQILEELSLSNESTLASIISLGTLLFAASGVFVEIQDSINDIWALQVKSSSGFLGLIKDRLLSFSMIAVLGFLLLVTLVVNSALDVFSTKLADYFDVLSIILIYILNNVILISIISFLFFIIYKVLPDAKFNNRVSFIGAFLTSALFLIGKALISFYLANSNISTIYGSGGTLVILLLWVYYSSMILYFGAAFTKNLAFLMDDNITSSKTADFIKKK